MPADVPAAHHRSVGHDTAVIEVPGATGSSADHEDPFHVRPLPALSAATHDDAVAHDTAVRWRGVAPAATGSMVRGNDQAAPFQTVSLPAVSTVTQKDGLGHDTPVYRPRGSPEAGLDHEVPSHREGPPPAATQNEGDAHEMAAALPQAFTADDQDDPSKVNPSPMPSMAVQKEGDAHPTACRVWAPGSGVAVDHAEPFQSATRFPDGTATHRVGDAHPRRGPGWPVAGAGPRVGPARQRVPSKL